METAKLLMVYRFVWPPTLKEKECRVCGKKSKTVSRQLGVCVDCIRERPEEAMPYVLEAHASSRKPYGLPPTPPKTPGGIPCTLCSNECLMGPGERGFCGLRENVDGRLRSLVNPDVGLLYAYLDPHVTNCCAAWFCPAGTGLGYPKYAVKDGPEYGYYNLAVFFYGCNFNCLFCQNSSHKELQRADVVHVEEFVETVRSNERITCICYFGGSPEPQLPYAVRASRAVLEECRGRVVRVCFEWNGCGNPALVRRAAELSLESGGNIKFDLKCFDRNLSIALSGVPNDRAYENFRMIAEELYDERPEVPVLTATTLLVPGYVDASEVEAIAEFIADLNPEIPYSLLIFHPDWMMSDLPVTPLKDVLECYRAARRHLRNVNVGNLHLVGLRSMEELRQMA